MKKNVIKIIMMILGIGVFVEGIIISIDGIGRFAMILFGTIFSVIGSILPFEKK